MRHARVQLTSSMTVALALSSLLFGCGDSLRSQNRIEELNTEGQTELQTPLDNSSVASISIFIEDAELRGGYQDVDALVDRAVAIGFSYCIRLDGGDQIYSGFGPCLDARTISASVSTPGAAPTATPIPTSTPSSNDCISSGVLVCVDTSIPARYFPKTRYAPNPTEVHAFKFITGPDSYQGEGVATRSVGGQGGKLIVISEIPGDIDTSNKEPGCYRSSVESTTAFYVVNSPSMSSRYFCHLEASKTYYFNVAARNLSSTDLTCSTPSECDFTFTAR